MVVTGRTSERSSWAGRRPDGFAWLLPVAVGASLWWGVLPSNQLHQAIGGLVGLGLVALVARRPDRGLLVLTALLPFHTLTLAFLYSHGLPAAVVRPLSGWKEAVAVGIVVAGFRGFLAAGKRLDTLDRLALAYVACVAIYALVPGIVGADAPAEGTVRFLGFRGATVFVLVLLGARHARLPQDFGDRALRLVIAVATVVAAIGVFEFFFDSTWNDFVVDTIQFPRYSIEILDVVPFRVHDVRTYGIIAGREILRVGSIFLNSGALGFYLLLGFAAAVERVVRLGARGASVVVLLLIGAALLLTQTRSALIGALVVAFVAFRPAPGRRPRQRVQLALLLCAGILLALPAAFATGLASRLTTAATGDDESAIGHIDAFWEGMRRLEENPLGEGLGTSAGTGQRFTPGEAFISENNYIQVGIETGVLTMAVFIGLTVVLVRSLRRAQEGEPDTFTATIAGAGFGLAVGAFFLHTWTDLAVAWTFWGMAGAVLGLRSRRISADAAV